MSAAGATLGYPSGVSVYIQFIYKQFISIMHLIPLDYEALFVIMSFALAFEAVRLILGYVVGAEPREIRVLTEKRLRILAELASIKSVQVEFVKSSLMERQKIKAEKDLENAKYKYKMSLPRKKMAFRVIRVVTYAAFAYFFTQEPIIIIDSVLFWPYAAFASSCNMQMNVWTLLPLSAFASRFLLRSVAPTLLSGGSA